MARWLDRFKELLTRERREADLERELRSHLEAEVEDQLDAGVPHDEARYAARRALGNLALIKEDTRAMWGWTTLEALIQDLRLGFRLLGRNRTFALFSVLSLALGIGATSAVFSLFDAIVRRQLPVADPGRLVVLSFSLPGRSRNSILPYPHFERMRNDGRTLDGLFAWAAYTVRQRTPELGLRMALGASSSGIRWSVLRDSSPTVLTGALAGILFACGGPSRGEPASRPRPG